jgi:hypothetical protein
MGRKKRNTTKVVSTVAEHRPNRRESARCSPDGDAETCFGLGHMKYFHAIDEHARAGLLAVEPPMIHLRDMRDEIDFDSSRLREEM